MKITGYRTLTEKERDYLTIHRLLLKHKIPIPEMVDFLGILIGKGFITLPADVLNFESDDVINLEILRSQYDSLFPFCITCGDSPNYHLRLDQLPENTTELFIETK